MSKFKWMLYTKTGFGKHVVMQKRRQPAKTNSKSYDRKKKLAEKTKKTQSLIFYQPV